MSNSPNTRAWAVSGLIFGACMMVVLGVWQIVTGIAALAKDEFFVVMPNYAYEVDTTTWGWIHLILGILVLLAGLFLFGGSGFARGFGIFLGCLVAVNNFFFLPYYPLWSILMIALSVFVVWSLATVTKQDLDSA